MVTNTFTLKKGYINGELVVAHEYSGRDAGLSYYSYKGKTYAGLVAFSKPISVETIQY